MEGTAVAPDNRRNFNNSTGLQRSLKVSVADHGSAVTLKLSVLCVDWRASRQQKHASV